MTSSTFAGDESQWNEFATGHYIDEVNGEPRPVSLEVTRAYFEAWSAAGSVVSNAIDMLQWLKFQVNSGSTPDDSRLLNRTQFEFTHQPSMQKRAPPRWRRPLDPVTYKFGTHSVAWSEHTYRDFQISQHIGGETGFQSLITVSQAAQLGIFTGINKDPHQVRERVLSENHTRHNLLKTMFDYEQGAMDFIHMYIMDLLMNEEPWLNSSAACDLINTQQLEEDVTSDPEERCTVCVKLPYMFEKSKTSRNISADDVTGTFGHYAYGNASIVTDDVTEQLLFIYGKEGK